MQISKKHDFDSPTDAPTSKGQTLVQQGVHINNPLPTAYHVTMLPKHMQ